MISQWPEGFVRIPDEDWTRSPVEELALKYDTVQNHGWYRNLDLTVEQLGRHLREGQILLDYSGGTGILASRLLEELRERSFFILIVDSSPKFLRLAAEKLGRQPRVALRLIRYLKDEGRLQLVHEVLEGSLLERGLDAVVSTNAIHLYYDLEETVSSWSRVLRPGGRAFVQSGNIGLPYMPAGSWIIDETVEAIARQAEAIVRSDPKFAAYRPLLDDERRMDAYRHLRRKVFLPVRPIAHYLASLEAAGLRILEVTHLPILAHADQWYEFLSTYHEGVLGWVGGSAKVEGTEPSEAAVADRLELIERGLTEVLGGRQSFQAIWTYITAEKP